MLKSELMREFIHDCLYNPSYGYFNKNVNIFQASNPIPFNVLKDQNDYMKKLKKLYEVSYHSYQSTEEILNTNFKESFQQLWHTPSELFKPFYGRAVTKFIISQSSYSHLSSHTKSNFKLIIYEIGPGNGTLAENILDCLREEYPTIYEETEYNLVEISDRLRCKQIAKLSLKHANQIRFPKLNFLNLKENKFKEERDCWVVGMEVLDNLAHDLIKFSNEDGSLLEATVQTDPTATYGSVPGRYKREFRAAEDSLIFEYVRMGDELGWEWPSLRGKPLLRAFERLSPFEYINPWSCEFIPTTAFNLLKNLSLYFPNHRVIFSDFDELPNSIAGHNGPVVQTRFRGETVPCSTVLLERGLFDIFFPTDFKKLSQIHKKLCNMHHTNNNCANRQYSIQKHADFLKKWSNPDDINATTTRSGYNPMIQDFENVSFYTFT